MNLKKLHKKIDEVVSRSYSEGMADGYESCMQVNGIDLAYDNGNDNGIEAGIKLEQERIINLLSNADRNKTHSRSTECSLCQTIDLIKGE